MDLLESEFKKVLLENNEKFRQLKSAFDERCKSEQDCKQLMRVAVQKNNEYEVLVNDMQQNLIKLKKEVSEIMIEKESLQTEFVARKNNLQQ